MYIRIYVDMKLVVLPPLIAGADHARVRDPAKNCKSSTLRTEDLQGQDMSIFIVIFPQARQLPVNVFPKTTY